ncbi:hypothetical protein [Paenibacillus beijingensis]|uniref:Uncharacterized protein n=1 Tax=Paenibacillus beijingensis TaxID=1126833 RepID=A0A0D5NFK0_9BACL|nr:hypothetical protein [Paenibacillus beijingensis]AJY73678.1 hypothetical protein VN24_02320 [Paenibacillus beijingensis]
MIVRFLHQTSMELLLLLKLRWPLLLPAAAGVWMLIHTQSPTATASQDVNLYAFSEHSNILVISTVVPVLLGVLMLRRDLLHPSYEWMLRLPVSGAGWIAAKWTAGFLYMSLFTLAVHLGYAVSALRMHLPLSSLLHEAVRFSLIYEQSYGISLALGMFLGVLLPLRFALPVAFCGWMFGSIFLQLYVVRTFRLTELKAFYLHPLIDSQLLENEIWSPVLTLPDQADIALFNAAFGLFLLCASWALLGKYRPSLHRGRTSVIALAALALSGAAFIPYANLVQSRTNHQLELAAVSPGEEELEPNHSYSFRLYSIRIEAARLPDNSLQARAVLTVPTESGQLLPADPGRTHVRAHVDGYATFLLYPTLTVDSLQVNGMEAQWQRDGDKLSIPLQQLDAGSDKQTVIVTYHGPIDEWTRGYNNESYLTFIRQGGAYLPANIGWYPLPGGDSLLYKPGGEASIVSERQDMNRFTSADFDVTLTGFQSKMFATLPSAADDKPVKRHFSAAGVSGVSLYGGAFERVTVPGEPVSIVTTPGNREESRRFLERLHERRQYFEGMTGERLSSLRQIIYFPMNLVESPGINRQQYTIGDTFIVPESQHGNLDFYLLDTVTNMLLFGDAGKAINAPAPAQHAPDPSLVSEIRWAFGFMYNEYLQSSAIDNVPVLSDPSLNDNADSYREAIRQMIDAAVMRGDGPKVWKVLNRFRTQGLRLPVPINAAGMRETPAYDFPVITPEEWLREWHRYMPEDGMPRIGSDPN